MKRSEMILELKRYNEIALGEISDIIHDSYYDVLLSTIEKAGMLPPKYTKFLDDSGVKKPSEEKHSECPVVGMYSVRYTMPNYVDVNEWEEENEKK